MGFLAVVVVVTCRWAAMCAVMRASGNWSDSRRQTTTRDRKHHSRRASQDTRSLDAVNRHAAQAARGNTTRNRFNSLEFPLGDSNPCAMPNGFLKGTSCPDEVPFRGHHATEPPRTPTVQPAIVRPVAAQRYKLQVTINEETRAKLRRAQDLLRHTNRNGDEAAVIGRALTLLIEQLEKAKFGSTTWNCAAGRTTHMKQRGGLDHSSCGRRRPVGRTWSRPSPAVLSRLAPLRGH